MKKIVSLLLIIFSLFIVSGNVSFAVDNANCGTDGVGLTTVGIDLLSDPTGRSCPDLKNEDDGILANVLSKKVYTVVKVILGFSATIGLVAFVYAGVMILLSNGNPKAYQDGMNVIKYTFIGIVIIIFSYAIVNFLVTTIPNVTKGGTGGTGSFIENGDYCNGNGSSALGKCYYLLDNYIQSAAYLSDWNKTSSVCGLGAAFCRGEGAGKYCLRCVDKTIDPAVLQIMNSPAVKKPL